jgi:uncharacterized delta-60 repeat protein
MPFERKLAQSLSQGFGGRMKRIALIASIAALVFAACSSSPAPSAEAPVDTATSELTANGLCIVCPPPIKPGSLDTSFGQIFLGRPGTGKVTTSFGYVPAGLSGMAIQADNKIVIAQRSQSFDSYASRFTPSGLIDNTFGSNGSITLKPSHNHTRSNSVAVQPDGKIVISVTYDYRNYDIDSNDRNSFGVLRYNANGAEDPDFKNPYGITYGYGNKPRFGAFEDPVGSYYQLPVMALQANGQIVLATRSLYGDFIIVTRHDSNGSTDTTFGTNGYVYTTTYPGHISYPTSIAVQADGKIVVAGYDTPANGSTSDFAIVRYNTNGSLDSSFDGDGIARVGFVGYSSDFAKAVKIQADGKIVVAGYSNVGTYGFENFVMARLNTNGSMDSSFGSGGLVKTGFGTGHAFANAMVIQVDGKIVLAGKANPVWDDDFALARYNSNGSLDTTFGTGGMVTTSFGPGEDVADVVAIQNGKIVLAGTTYNSNGVSRMIALARYNP